MMLNRVSLNTIGLNRIGLNRIGKPSRGSSERPYIDPEVLASLKAVCICYGKSNDDPDRAIVKNLVDPDNPFVISNAAYTEGSGYADKDSPYYGAFVTDGIDDLITSTKSATEMLDGSNEITVVSMIHQIKTNSDVTRNNWFFTPVSYLENRVVENKTGKTGIYGYTSTNVTNAQISDITPILGDKNDYTLYSKIEDGDRDYFTVEGFQNQGIWYVSSIAWYWTIIANKVLTTDQINQVIAYFNLDRTLKPDILCNVKKQGITNENHAEFGDRLIDFSGNGRDIQLNNLAWDGDSGIGKYNYPNWKVTATIANTYSTIVNYPTVNGTYSINVNGVSELMQSIGLHLEIKYTTSTGIIYNDIKQDGVYSYILPDGATDLTLRFGGIPGIVNEPCNITITQIPSHAGALCLDGVNDFGKVTGMPIYKDYTFIIDREIISIGDTNGIVASKSEDSTDVNKQGAFLFEYLGSPNNVSAWSFYKDNGKVANTDFTRGISYQSKYSYNGIELLAGTAFDSDKLWLGTLRDKDSRFANVAIYSLMSFPYSMSEFLIERQLKKHKLGTLYPDMVEWRPIYTSNVNDYTITKATYFGEAGQRDLALGNHYPIGARFRIYVKPSGAVDEVTSIKVNGVELTYDYIDSNYGYAFNGTLSSKSPQKIDITIDEYIRYEDIVQPYPAFYEFTDEDKNLVTWGSKVKVGTTITRIKAFVDSNLLKDLYTISYPKLNGISSSSSKYVVEKQMVFTCNATYIKGSNAPKCILSPSRLRIPNSSYKILRHIPDISGHGNHGVIYNSAYAEGSGVNEDGSYQFDGVDDFVIIPTLSKSGKQVLMKINWNTEYYNRFIVDFRKVEGDTNYIINDFNALSNSLAYQNANKTYIDGILNNSIKTLELKGVTHNIVSQFIKANSSPYIGARTGNGDNMTMSLYDFMLFDEISTDEEILTLNEYVGIEGNTDDLFTENN